MGFFRQTSRTRWHVNQMDKIAKKGEDHIAWLDAQIARLKLGEQFRKNVLFDYERRLENRAKKAKAQETHATCQICARRIQANTGVIAHHGYTRPGHGWQTASCFGARYRPYEIACDAIEPYIAMVRQHKESREAGLKGLLEEPPEEFTVVVKFKPYEAVKYQRPDDFNVGKAELDGAFWRSKYENEWRARVYDCRSQIKNATWEIARMTKRLAEWKPKKEKKA